MSIYPQICSTLYEWLQVLYDGTQQRYMKQTVRCTAPSNTGCSMQRTVMVVVSAVLPPYIGSIIPCRHTHPFSSWLPYVCLSWRRTYRHGATLLRVINVQCSMFFPVHGSYYTSWISHEILVYRRYTELHWLQTWMNYEYSTSRVFLQSFRIGVASVYIRSLL